MDYGFVSPYRSVKCKKYGMLLPLALIKNLSIEFPTLIGGPVDQPGNEGEIFPHQQNDRPLGKL